MEQSTPSIENGRPEGFLEEGWDQIPPSFSCPGPLAELYIVHRWRGREGRGHRSKGKHLMRRVKKKRKNKAVPS